jgi:hypothetical protein
LKLNERFGSLAASLLLGQSLLELGDLLGARIDHLGLAPALSRLEPCQLSLLPRLPPHCQM